MKIGKIIYRQQVQGRLIYELGVIQKPRTSPELWCDYRLCEGFWGMDEKDVKKLVNKMNKS